MPRKGSQATGKAHSPQTTHANYGKRGGWKAVRDQWKARPVPERGPWEQVEWWLQRSDALPALECEKSITHGVAAPYFHTDRMGKALGYVCRQCGWRKVVLVQDGPAEPCAPVTEIKLNNHQLGALNKTKEAQQRGARIRAENIARNGLKRRKAWWEDVEDDYEDEPAPVVAPVKKLRSTKHVAGWRKREREADMKLYLKESAK